MHACRTGRSCRDLTRNSPEVRLRAAHEPLSHADPGGRCTGSRAAERPAQQDPRHGR